MMRQPLMVVYPMIRLPCLQGVDDDLLQLALNLFSEHNGFPGHLTALHRTKDGRYLLAVGYTHVLPRAGAALLDRLIALDGEPLIKLGRGRAVNITVGVWINGQDGFETTACGKEELQASKLELELAYPAVTSS